MFAQKALAEFGFSSKAMTIEERINKEVRQLIHILENIEGPFDPKVALDTSISRVIVGIVLGKHISYDDQAFQSLIHLTDKRVRLVGINLFLINAFPFLWHLTHLPCDILRVNRILSFTDEIHKYSNAMFEEKLQSFDENNIRNFVDQYIKEINVMERTQKESTFSAEMFQNLFDDMIGAGTETSSTTIRWLLLFLLKNHELQTKLHQEIDSVLGRDSQPSLNDRSRLPYVEAAIMETLRLANVTPLAVPHSVPEDIQFNGYLIPKNTSVLVNLNSVLMDPDVWEDPMVFRPERFLKTDGSLHVPKEFIPFSLGRRSCLGESLARMEMFLYVTTLLQKFEIQLPKGDPLPDSRGDLILLYTPKPFRIQLRRR